MTVERIGGRIRAPRKSCLCGKRFVPKRKNQRHCSPQCRSREAQRKWRAKVQTALELQAAQQEVVNV